MRLELRKTGEDLDHSIACPECGATEPVVRKDGTLLAADLEPVLEAEVEARCATREKLLRDELDKRVGEQRALVQTHLRQADKAVTAAYGALDDFREAVLDRLQAMTEDDVSWWRRVKRRRERVLAQRVQEVVDQLKEDTRKV